jgi:alcohol dehydrogenase class IV
MLLTGYFTAPRIASGPGALEQLGALGLQRAVVLAEGAVRSAERTVRFVEELTRAGARVERVDAPPGEPTVASVEAIASALGERSPDGIVAIGGGSVIDLAKAAWLRYERPDLRLEEVTPLTELGLRRRARLVAVPTTAGSGSEATGTAFLHRPDAAPLELGSRELEPDWALLDPYYLTSLPPGALAVQGFDALAHALEAIASDWSTPFTDALAREAAAIVARELPRAIKKNDELETLGRLQAAATMGGLAVANAQLGCAHALAHAVSATSGLPHAAAVAVLLPYVVEFNFPSARDRYLGLQGAFGPGPLQSAPAFGQRLRALAEEVGAPRSLARAGLPPERLRVLEGRILDLAAASPSLLGNPRLPSREELARILSAASEGGALAS